MKFRDTLPTISRCSSAKVGSWRGRPNPIVGVGGRSRWPTSLPSLAAVAVLCCVARPAVAGPIEDLQPGEWYEVPASNLDAVAGPNPGVGGIYCVMSCWAGGAFDTTRERLYVTGGGHAGYAGNEIYAFDMNELAWSRLNEFTPLLRGSECPDPEVASCATHTYDGIEYLPPPIDRLIVAGCCMQHTYLFDPEALTWEVVDPPVELGNTIGNISSYDPITQRFLYETTFDGKLYTYDAAQQVWSTIAPGPYLNYSRNGAVDPTRRLFVIAGSGEGEHGTENSLIVWNLDEGTWSAVAAGGDPTVASLHSPGLDYDSVTDRIVAWAGGGDVYSLDLDAFVWEKHTPSGDVIPTAANVNGTYGRFRYVPSKNVFVAVNNTNENVFVYRSSPGAGPGDDTGNDTGASSDESGATTASVGDDASSSASEGPEDSTTGTVEGSSATNGGTDAAGNDGQRDASNGCGCTTAPGPWSSFLALVLALIGRRRRNLLAGTSMLLGACAPGPSVDGQLSGGGEGDSGSDEVSTTSWDSQGDGTLATSASADANESDSDDPKFDLAADTGEVPEVECEDEDNPIYVLTHETPAAIHSFDPQTATFTKVVDVVCPETDDWALSSMAVDRHRRAWIQWSGEATGPENPYAKRLDRIDLDTGVCEVDVAPLPTPANWGVPFGMAFVTASEDDTSEELYFVDHATYIYTLGGLAPIGKFHVFGPKQGTEFSGVELTGTGGGRLFDLIMNGPCSAETCPSVDVGEVDKSDASPISNVELLLVPALGISPGGFAFAHWGGRFWIFISKDFGPTSVYDYDPVMQTTVLATSAGVDGVVGAGVSTCAPLVFPRG